MYPEQVMQNQQQQLSPEPVFQRLEADLLSCAGHGDDMDNKTRFGPDGSPLPPLEISSLPREKEEIRKARARLISPVSFKKAFSIKKKGSDSGSASGSGSIGSGSPSTDSTASLPNSSSEEVGKISEPATPTAAVSRMPPQLPTLATQDMESWAAAIPAEARPISPVELPSSPLPEAPPMQMSPSIDSEAYPPTIDSTDGSSSTAPLSPVFSNSQGSNTSRSSIDGRSSLNSYSNASASGRRKHRVATSGLTKLPSSPTVAAVPTLDPHLARVNTRQRSSGSVSSHTPSIALSATSSAGRRVSRRSGRSRITDSMPSFADMASSLTVPVSNQRRFSNRSLSSEGSVDNHSNASNGSSYAKVGGSSDDGIPPMSPSLSAPKSVLRKRSPSEVSSLRSPKKEVSFDIPASSSFGVVAEDSEEDKEEVLEHEERQRSHLKLPPMKLQAAPGKRDSAGEEAKASVDVVQSRALSQDDLDIVTFLSSFGSELKTIESLEVLDTVHAGANEWPQREDWDSLPAYLMAYATTFLSIYSDDSATLVYSADRAPAKAAGEGKKAVPAPILSSNPLYTSLVRSVVRIASWEQPLVSAGVSSAYAYSWAKGRLAAMTLVGLALLVATQGAQMGSSSASSDSQELSEAYGRIATVILGSSSTHERMRNLLLWRSPRASLRFTGLLLALALALGATRFDSSLMLQLPGLLLGLALFVWLPIILHQPTWAPAWLSKVNPIDVLLYDVPTDAQHAILTLRRRAASGEQLVHLPDSPARNAALQRLPSLSPTSFDHRVSAQELTHVSDILEGSHFAIVNKEPGHLIILTSRVIFRTLAGKSSDEEPISLVDELVRTSASGGGGCKITLDARLEKVVKVDKVEAEGLKLRLKNGQEFEVEKVVDRDQAFNRLMALAPQRWH
ncbi:hypothetical protein NDA16_004934 [Ustilago loliicola]|nr:hypothetical protein NDA16_004934 [Ustilago loliicola]